MNIDTPTSQAPHRTRRLWLLFIFNLLIVSILVIRAATLAAQAGQHRAELPKPHLLPGMRGALLTADGTPLAWSMRRLSLVWEVPKSLEEAEASWQVGADVDIFQGLMPAREELPGLLGTTWMLVEDALNYPAAIEMMALLDQPEFHAVGHTIRCTLARPDQLETLGETVVDSTGVEKGISGLELKYDALLRAGLAPVVVSVTDGSVLRLPTGFFNRNINGQNVRLHTDEWPYEISETVVEEMP
ncbi:MAG: hypothetical protein J6Y80_02730 [Victivallales bacterium]|nr:hypothetical protein [Victivallales bacterium]